MKIGDIVRPGPGHLLRSGCSSYTVAIVATLSPFSLISPAGDMRWSSNIKPENFVVVAESKLPLPQAVAEAVVNRLAVHALHGEDGAREALIPWTHILYREGYGATPEKLVELLMDRTRAERLARQAFEGITRRDGRTPAIRHMEAGVKHLRERMEFDKLPIETRLFRETVMWLHDYYEDIKDAKNLISLGFSEHVHYNVQRMTRDRSKSYVDFCRDMLGFPDACYCKVSDVCANIGESPTDDQLLKYSQVLPWLVLSSR